MRVFIALFDRAVQSLIVLTVVSIVFFSCLNIALRWFEMTLTFIEPLVRHLVFLSAFLGAVLATGSDRHIKIDLLQKYLSKKNNLRKFIAPFYFLVILITLVALTYSSLGFTRSEFEYGKVQFLGIHSGYLTSIIPLGFILMSFRHILRVFEGNK